MAEKQTKKSITMKKGTATINVDENRKKHYESLGYSAAERNTFGSAEKSRYGENGGQ